MRVARIAGLLGGLLAATVAWRPLALQAQSTATARNTDSLRAAGVSDALATLRRSQLRDITYDLHLDLSARDRANGRVTVSFTRLVGGPVLLDFRGLTLDTVVVNATAVAATRPDVWDGAHIALPDSLLTPGRNRVSLAFSTPIAASGASIIRTRDTDGDDYLYTLLVPSDANLLFPSFDQPDLKARLTLSLRTPTEWRALSNGALVARDSSASAVTHRFATTDPISTYLMAFAAGPWATHTRNVEIEPGGERVPVTLWARRSRMNEVDADTLIAMNARALVWLGEWFKVPYPFAKYDLLLAPAFPFGGMEHPGAVFYNEQRFIFRERPTATQLLGRQATTFHEVAHQWFGDFVTMRWFDDLWLKEGFATFMAAVMQDALEPDAEAWKSFYLRNKPVAYGTDATAGTTPVWQRLANLDQAKSNYGPIVYNKAPAVLRQLQFLVGEDVFQRGIREFLQTYRFGNATWQELLHEIGAAAGRDLAPWGQQWMVRPGMPVIEQILDIHDDRITRLALVQRPAQPSVSGAGAWPLKVNVRVHYPLADDIVVPVELTTDTTEIPSVIGKPAPAYVFANDGDYGYALVMPDSISVAWLDSGIASVENPLRRAMLWGALWDLVRDARYSPAHFASLALRALPNEADEEIATVLVGRLRTAVGQYGADGIDRSLGTTLEQVLQAGIADTMQPYGQRKAQLDALIGLARTPAALSRIDGWLNQDSVLGLPLQPPTRWAIVSQLVANNTPTSAARFIRETQRDSTPDGGRRAFVARAGTPSADVKREYFTRWFADAELNEEWATASLRAFHEPEQSALTRPFLEASLDSLPFIQQNRRIFFLGSWLSALLGGQTDADALASVDAWLGAHPDLPIDLRQKVLQARDDLERTVRIRSVFLQ